MLDQSALCYIDSLFLYSTNYHLASLAYAELYLGIAILIRRFDMELYNTTIADVEIQRDHFIPAPSKTSNGVRIRVWKIAE